MKYFFELIQIAVGTRDEFSGIPTPNTWKRLYRQAQRQALLGVLFSAIEKLPAAQLPPKQILLPWYDITEKIKKQNQILNEEAVQVGKYLEEQGMTYTLLKGQGNAMYYPHPLHRTPGDLDIWIRKWIHPDCSLFKKRREVYSWIKKTFGPLEGVSYNHVHAPLSPKAEVELHVTPSFMSAVYLNAPLQQYFLQAAEDLSDTTVDLPEGVGRIQVPTVEFNRFYVLLHIYRHFFSEGIGLRQLMDYYYILCQPSSVESRERTLCLIKQMKMERFTGAVMFIMQRLFCLDKALLLMQPDGKEGSFLLEEILRAGNFGLYDMRINRKAYSKRWKRFPLSVKRNLRFVRRYPHEILCDPLFRTSFYLYRKAHRWGN